MNISKKKDDRLGPLLARLRELLGTRVEVLQRPGEVDRADPLLRLGVRPAVLLSGTQAHTQRMTPEYARHIAIQAVGRARRADALPVVLAEWIPDAAAAELRTAGIGYLDAVGNAHLDLAAPRVHIDIRGRRPEGPPRAEPGRLIEPAGLKVLHYLLTDPAAAEEPYRRIAGRAGAALGTVAAIFRELARAGHLVRTGHKIRRLENREALVDLFVRGYALKLRPACRPERFRHREHDAERLAERLRKRLGPRRPGWAFTGGIAAQQLTRYLRPDIVALFVDAAARERLRGEPMLPAPEDGNVLLLEYFAPAALGEPKRNLATPLLVYAELVHDGRAREIETARMIYDRHLQVRGPDGT